MEPWPPWSWPWSGFKTIAGSPAADRLPDPFRHSPGRHRPGFGPDPPVRPPRPRPSAPAFPPPGSTSGPPSAAIPAPDTFAVAGRTLVAEYAADSLMHARIGLYLDRYRPDAAVVLACDLAAGRMLGVGERGIPWSPAVPRMAFRSGFPGRLPDQNPHRHRGPGTQGQGPGGLHPPAGLLPYPVPPPAQGRPQGPGPKVTLQEAFSRSVNPAFGVLGLAMGGEALRRSPRSMGFNRPFACVRPSLFQATGYRLRPGRDRLRLHAQDHHLPHARPGHRPRHRRRRHAPLRRLRPLPDRHHRRPAQDSEVRPETGTVFVSPANLPKLQALMEATVRSGTARKGFHQVLRGHPHVQKIDGGRQDRAPCDGDSNPRAATTGSSAMPASRTIPPGAWPCPSCSCTGNTPRSAPPCWPPC